MRELLAGDHRKTMELIVRIQRNFRAKIARRAYRARKAAQRAIDLSDMERTALGAVWIQDMTKDMMAGAVASVIQRKTEK